jgi:hypothetical protein
MVTLPSVELKCAMLSLGVQYLPRAGDDFHTAEP